MTDSLTIAIIARAIALTLGTHIVICLVENEFGYTRDGCTTDTCPKKYSLGRIDSKILIRMYRLHLDVFSQIFLRLSESLQNVSVLGSHLSMRLHLGRSHLVEIISTKWATR